MGWLSLFSALLGFLASLKKNPGNKAAAVATGALAGLGTYYVTHETEWGKENLGQFDGVPQVPKADPNPLNNITLPDGTVVPKTTTSVPSVTTGQTTGLWDTVKNLGPGGVAAVVGTAGVVTGAIDLKKILPWALGAVALIFLVK